MVKTRKCSCATCDATIAGFLLMCQTHWMMVPSGLRQKVQEAYREGRELRIHPTQKYIDARDAAVAVVNEKVRARWVKAGVQPQLALS